MTSVVRPQPLMKFIARKIHNSFEGSMPLRKNRIRLARAATVMPMAVTSFLPFFPVSFGRKNMKMIIGE